MKKKNIDEGVYALEVNYGWATDGNYKHFCDAEAAFNQEKKNGAKYRLVDVITGEVLLEAN